METLLFDTLLALGVALCPLGIIVLLIWFVVSVALPIHQRLQELRRLKATPCDRCYYFNPDPELHCAVHPDLALTRLANTVEILIPDGDLLQPCGPIMGTNHG